MLILGNQFNRSYNFRLPFLNNCVNVGCFFNKKSSFLLFDFNRTNFENDDSPCNATMFKNLQSSKFCELFINLNSHRSENLDIVNQFKDLNNSNENLISYILNEEIVLSKHIFENKVFFDKILFYGFTLNDYEKEFIFLIAERQNINVNIQRKIVRTTAIQISTAKSFSYLEELHSKIFNNVRKIIKD